jgi:hypothetical protein
MTHLNYTNGLDRPPTPTLYNTGTRRDRARTEEAPQPPWSSVSHPCPVRTPMTSPPWSGWCVGSTTGTTAAPGLAVAGLAQTGAHCTVGRSPASPPAVSAGSSPAEVAGSCCQSRRRLLLTVAVGGSCSWLHRRLAAAGTGTGSPACPPTSPCSCWARRSGRGGR